jgi:hypothetical protein
MVLNACINPGYLGNFNITPDRIIVSGEQNTNLSIKEILEKITQIACTVTISGEPNSVIDLNGEIKVGESDSLQSGIFDFQFTNEQINKYSISRIENGFTFSITNETVSSFNSNPLIFTLNVSGFYKAYQGNLIIDSYSPEYGSVIAPIQVSISDKFFVEQTEDFLDQAPQQPAPPPPTASLDFQNIPQFKLGEYNFYLKEYEETEISEQNLLNINVNYSSSYIQNYFDNIVPLDNITSLFHSNEYMKELYPKFDKQKFLFPMHIENRFKAENEKTQLTTFLKKIGLLDYVCFYLISKLNLNNTIFDLLNNLKTDNNFNFESYLYTGDRRRNLIPYIRNNPSSFQKTILLFLLEKEIFQKKPNLIAVDGGEDQIGTGLITTLKQFYQNQVLMYKISKFKSDNLQTPINQQYFINIFENEELTYFDTQVKYDTLYQYRFYKIEILADGSIVETEIQNYRIENIKIVDYPPLPPDVTYIPYKGIDNKILINLNPSSGRYVDYPIIIKNDDIEVFNNIIQNSAYNILLTEQKKVQFETDDDYAMFEIYRLEKTPKSYSDFENAKFFQTENSSFEDEIEPNKKYYYISRIKDIHGNISNPTKPIEIQMINENGTIFLLKREYMFGEENKILSKNIKNLLQIKLNKEQSAINNEKTFKNAENAQTAADVINNLTLSNKEITVWGKQFLIRVTSKSTGKKIDLRFKFKHPSQN